MIPIETSGSASGSALSTKHRLTQMVAPNLSIYVRNTTPEVASGSIPQHASDTMLSVVNYTAYKEPQSSNRPDERSVAYPLLYYISSYIFLLLIHNIVSLCLLNGWYRWCHHHQILTQMI